MQFFKYNGNWNEDFYLVMTLPTVAQSSILFGRGQSKTSSVTDAFLTVENWYKILVKILASLFRGGPWPLRPHSGCASNFPQRVCYRSIGRFLRDVLARHFEKHRLICTFFAICFFQSSCDHTLSWIVLYMVWMIFYLNEPKVSCQFASMHSKSEKRHM